MSRLHSLLTMTAIGGVIALSALALKSRGEGRGFSPASPEQTHAGDADGRVEALEERLRRLEANNVRPAAAELLPPAAPAVPAPTPRRELSSEEAAAQNERNHKAAIDNHDKEVRDPTWAPVATTAFTTELGAMGKGLHFNVEDVDCRTSSCTARLAFDDFGAAQHGWKKVLTSPYSTNCAREILLDAPGTTQGTYRTTAVFDCTAARTQ